MTPAEIAARLTDAQREALLAICETHFRPVEIHHLIALAPPWALQLLVRSGQDWTLSDLGQQVRAILAAEAQRDG